MVVGVAAVVGALAIAAEAGSTYAYGTTASAGVGAVAGKNEVRRAAGAGIFMTVTEIMCLAYTSGIMGVIIGAGVAAKMQPHALSILLTAVLGAVASAAAAVGTSASHSGTARLKAAASNGRGALSRTEEGQVEGEARRLGPFAWLALGASELMPSGEQRGGGGARTTWDCWKPILHNESPEPSDGGVLLKDVVNDPRVRVVRAVGTTLAEGEVGMPDIVLENIWGEQFQIQIVSLADTLALAAHATRIPPVVGSS